MVKIDWHPGRDTLARFARTAPFGFGLFGFVIAWKTGTFSGNTSWAWPISIWTNGAFIFVLGWLAPKILKPIYLILVGFGWLIFSTIGFVAMTVIFFLFLTPIAWILRLGKRREIDCVIDPSAKSYWKLTDGSKPRETYFRQS